MFKSSNPFLREDMFSRVAHAAPGASVRGMTIQGTLLKTLLLMVLSVVSAGVTWAMVANSSPLAFPVAIGGAIGGFVLALVVGFKPKTAPYLGPAYALLQGLFIGAISSIFERSFPGVVVQAVLMTFGVAIAMLLAYQSGLIRATPMFVKIVIGMTLGIGVVYLISFGMSLFGARMPFLHEATPLGIGISVVILIVAALNLVLDFDFIEKGVEGGAPKSMEWFGAFALVVTLLWIYIESLRLLAKIREFTR